MDLFMHNSIVYRFSRVLKPVTGDWKLTLVNYFQPYSRTNVYMFIK